MHSGVDILDADDAFEADSSFRAGRSFPANDSLELVSGSGQPGRSSRRIVIAFYAIAVFGACSALLTAVWSAASGLTAAAVGGAAYTSAVVSDLANRRQRLREHGISSRPWLTAGLRIVVFTTAVLAAWISSKGISSP